MGDQNLNFASTMPYAYVLCAALKTHHKSYVALEYVFAEPIKESMQKSYNEFIQ